MNYGVQYNHHVRDVTMFDITKKNDKSYNYGYYAPWIMPGGKQDVTSFFMRDRMAITDKLTITPGIRYDYVRSEGEPNAAAIYNDPKPDTTIRRHLITVSHQLSAHRIR